MEDINEENISELQSDLKGLLEEGEENHEDEYLSDEEKRSREEILAIQDITEIGADEYLIFLDYSIANIYQIISTKIKIKIQGKHMNNCNEITHRECQEGLDEINMMNV